MQQNQGINQVEQDDAAEAEDEGIGVGASRQSKIIIIILVTIFVSAVIYFLFLREPSDINVVPDANQIVIGGGGIQPTRGDIVDYGATDLINAPTNDDFFTPRAQDSVPALPELPQLPEEIRQQIAAGATKQEETFTKEQVDKLVEDKIKEAIEQQMNILANQYTAQQQGSKEQVPGIQVNPPVQQQTPNKGGVNLDDIYTPGSTGGTTAGTSTTDILAQQQQEEVENLAKIQKSRALQERKAAPIFKTNGGVGPANSMPQDTDAVILSFTDAKINVESKAPDVVPTQITDLTKVILQGKVINAVLETAIDTDQASTVRAVITRDVYAEEGKNILIPRGSRVIGTYNTNITSGQTRVTINWNRIIRVDGMSLNIASIGADRLGRAGVQGDLDNKYAQQLANSFLSSVLSVGSAITVEKLNKSTGITNTISSLTGETTTTSGKASDYALIDATQQFMDDAKKIVDDIANQKPVIRIPQGEKVVIMVTQDVILPIFKRSGGK